MRSFVTALSVAFACVVLSVALRSEALPATSVRVVEIEAPRSGCWPSIVPLAAPTPVAPLTMPDESWCEPVVPIACDPAAPVCPVAPDGTPLRCVEDWFAGSGSHVCVADYPTRAVREWRAARLRVLVDAVCSRRDGCDPAALHAYLATLAMRETTLRPWKMSRLPADVAANALAWRRYADLYRDNPAAGDPARWMAGRGYFGQNAAAVLHVWDANAIPEALCGEVEATLTHLRTARKRWRQLADGVTCDGAAGAHHGTAENGEPSWYDVSLANSGSDPCPGENGHRAAVREGFVRRATSRGLAPYGRVTLAMLGQDVPRDEQARFASDVRRKMDAVSLQR